MQRILSWLDYYQQVAIYYVFAFIIATFILWFKLGSLVKGFNQSEYLIHNRILTHGYSITYLKDHIALAPYHIGLYLLQTLNLSDPTDIRSISAFIGLILIVCFYHLIRSWYDLYLAILSTALFAVNMWFLVTVRNGGSESLFALPLLLIIIFGFSLKNKINNNTILLIGAIIFGIMLYIPGTFWLLLVGLIWQQKFIRQEFTSLSAKNQALLIITFLIIITPLIWSLYLIPSQTRVILAIPTHFPTIEQFGANILSSFLSIFIWNNNKTLYSIGHLPLIDTFSLVLVIFGVFNYFKYRNLDRFKYIIIGIFFGLLLNAFNKNIPIFSIMPLVYLLIASGLSYLLVTWKKVFPVNPLAKGIGYALLTIAVASSIWLNFNKYYIAWPHTPTTLNSYNSHPI